MASSSHEGKDRSRVLAFQREQRQSRGPHFHSARLHTRLSRRSYMHIRAYLRTCVRALCLTSRRVAPRSRLLRLNYSAELFMKFRNETRSKILNSHAAPFSAVRATELLESHRGSYKFIVRVYTRHCCYRRRRPTHSLKATFSARIHERITLNRFTLCRIESRLRET